MPAPETLPLPFPSAANGHLDIKTLETWLWDAACSIRGSLDAPKYKDYILPLIFLKRLSDVFDDEMARVAEEFGAAGRRKPWFPGIMARCGSMSRQRAPGPRCAARLLTSASA